MRMHVLNPVAHVLEKKNSSAPRLPKLEEKLIGLYWNTKSGGDAALRRVEELLKARYAGLKTKSYVRRTMEGGNRFAVKDDLKKIAEECAGVIGSTAE